MNLSHLTLGQVVIVVLLVSSLGLYFSDRGFDKLKVSPWKLVLIKIFLVAAAVFALLYWIFSTMTF
jgi:hypothetical protein